MGFVAQSSAFPRVCMFKHLALACGAWLSPELENVGVAVPAQGPE